MREGGSPKRVKRRTPSATGAAQGAVVITGRALCRPMLGKGLVLKKVARGFTQDDVPTATAMESVVTEDVRLDAYGPSV